MLFVLENADLHMLVVMFFLVSHFYHVQLCNPSVGIHLCTDTEIGCRCLAVSMLDALCSGECYGILVLLVAYLFLVYGVVA